MKWETMLDRRHRANGALGWAILLCLLLLFPGRASARREHLTYFPDTAYELNVYKIRGRKPGKTLMLIGGIQGNEPGGFLSADLYADMSLEKGNLIVVPRANFYSILLNHRGPHGDMNRKFAPAPPVPSMEDRIVSILKKLIGESDYLLNLHDGSGYYYPKPISKWRGPTRFGQSIIADCEEYTIPGSRRTIRLGEMAREVIREVNTHIENELYRFHFNNTRTGAPDSRHKEQRKSATYYALTHHHIPAFGVETSKFLPSIDLKVRYHNLVINAFMRMFGIIPETPGFRSEPPALKYLVLSINNDTPIVVRPGERVMLRSGDSLYVSHIEANYERGLSLDILGYGELHDFRKSFCIRRNTAIVVRKDHQKFAEIPVRILSRGQPVRTPASRLPQGTYLVVEAKGYRILLGQNETLELVRGERMKILDLYPPSPQTADVTVNFKGFVGDWKNNTGEDRGYLIDTGSDLLKRYSLAKKGEVWEILATRGEEVIARFLVRLVPGH